MVRKLESYLADKARIDQDESDLTSRSDLRKARLKSEGHYKALAIRLCETSEKRLVRLGLSDLLIELVVAAKRIDSHEAKDRAVRRIRRELRDIDSTALERALDDLEQPQQTKPKRLETIWADRLLAGGEADLDAFLAEYSGADRGQLRTLLRNAARAKEADKEKTLTKLTRALRDAIGSRTSAVTREPDAQVTPDDESPDGEDERNLEIE